MDNRRLDKLHIRDLILRCIIGLNDWEREKKQDVLINITLYADLTAACQSDRIEDTVDYKTIKQKVVDMVESSSYMLVEGLAQHIADICLENPKVQRVKVMIDKTGALRFARSVGVEIMRDRR
jgi:D-erythro-7,8-dihydroneopterin triphosphate epimerase